LRSFPAILRFYFSGKMMDEGSPLGPFRIDRPARGSWGVEWRNFAVPRVFPPSIVNDNNHMPSINPAPQAGSSDVTSTDFVGFNILIDETIAHLIFQYTADTTIPSNAWSSRSAKTPSPKKTSSARILSRTFSIETD
jgi:hypothetical protein